MGPMCGGSRQLRTRISALRGLCRIDRLFSCLYTYQHIMAASSISSDWQVSFSLHRIIELMFRRLALLRARDDKLRMNTEMHCVTSVFWSNGRLKRLAHARTSFASFARSSTDRVATSPSPYRATIPSHHFRLASSLRASFSGAVSSWYFRLNTPKAFLNYLQIG